MLGAFPMKAVDTTGAGDSFVTKIVNNQYVLQAGAELGAKFRGSEIRKFV